MADWQTLCAQLYVPLKSSPCRCCQRFRKPTADNLSDTEVTHRCSRCIALAAYEAVVAP